MAVMDYHPCVAKVLDAGETDRSLPFFVMELVKGSPITDHCDRERLAIDRRLELFALVCDAIQDADTSELHYKDWHNNRGPVNRLLWSSPSAGLSEVPLLVPA